MWLRLLDGNRESLVNLWRPDPWFQAVLRSPHFISKPSSLAKMPTVIFVARMWK